MFLLGLLATICYVPGYTGTSIPTQWVFLSCALPFSLWRNGPFHFLHILGIAFVAYALLAATWATNYHTAVLGVWYVLIWALSFWLGSVSTSLTSLWKGVAVGLAISNGVALAQALDFVPVEQADPYHYAGLLFNHTVQGAAIALTIIALVAHRLWWYILPLPLGLILSGSRGSFLILGLTAVARYIHWLVALALLIAGSLLYLFYLDPADSNRLQLWGYALHGLTLLGWGPNTFDDVYYTGTDKLTGGLQIFRAGFTHNDYLQLWFEFGIAALVPYTILAFTLLARSAPDWPVAFAFAILSTFYFPLYCPLLAFLGALTAGHICRRYDPLWSIGFVWGPGLVRRAPAIKSTMDRSRCEGLPLVPRTSQSEG